MKILNLTQHAGTEEQIEDGLCEPEPKIKERISELLTFKHIPYSYEMRERAGALADIAKESGYRYVSIGGAPYFMSTLEHVLIIEGLCPMYSFSIRQSKDIVEDGETRKLTVFRHIGWIFV